MYPSTSAAAPVLAQSQATMYRTRFSPRLCHAGVLNIAAWFSPMPTR